MNCLSLIRQRYAGMSSVEKRIADCILAEPEKVMNSPLVYVAKKAKVSEGSVINFSNSLGYKGFSQLKINLAQYVSTYSVHDEVTREDSPKQILRKLINRAIVSFESTYDTIGQELQSATDLLSKAGKIVVVGVGHSMVIAKDISIRMMWLGLPAIAETDPLLAGTMSTQMKENDVIFAVSNSGRTREVLMVAQTAHSLGVKVIGLTSYPSSPLAKLSDVTLVSVSMEAQDYRESTTARLTQLMIGDCLIDCLTNRISNEAIVYLDKRVEVYEQHRESIN